MRRFYFDRREDLTGTSGTGAVAEGVEFTDGTVVLRWLTALASTAVYRNIEECEAIHGHGGATNLVWVDDEPSVPPVVPAPPNPNPLGPDPNRPVTGSRRLRPTGRRAMPNRPSRNR